MPKPLDILPLSPPKKVPDAQGPRIRREAQTAQAMIRLYCRKTHGRGSALCESCLEMSDFAIKRLDHCPFQEGKTTCAKCPVHCYERTMRQRIKDVMRIAGPHMLYRHPILATWHYIDSRRKTPIRPQRQPKNA